MLASHTIFKLIRRISDPKIVDENQKIVVSKNKQIFEPMQNDYINLPILI